MSRQYRCPALIRCIVLVALFFSSTELEKNSSEVNLYVPNDYFGCGANLRSC